MGSVCWRHWVVLGIFWSVASPSIRAEAAEKKYETDVAVESSLAATTLLLFGAGYLSNPHRPALTRAVLEGVAFAFRDNLAALRATGTEISRLLAVGGGARSEYWLQVIATTLNLSIDIPKSGEYGAALGAARLGLMAATGIDPASVCKSPEIAKTIEPDTSLSAAFSDAYARWRTAYPALKGAPP